MATVTTDTENYTSGRTYAVALTSADANKLALTLDLREFNKAEFQFVGTLPAGNIGFTGGLRAENLVINTMRVVRYPNLAAGTVVDTLDVFAAGRHLVSSSLPPFIGIVPSSTFTGTGTLYIRLSK
jgi:hypothetical protein